MSTSRRRHRACAILLVLCVTGRVAPEASAFTSDAAAPLAARALRGLPAGSWDPAWDGALAAAVAARLARERTAPEDYVGLHRFDGLAATGDAAEQGTDDAPRAFALAADTLAMAFAGGDPARWAEPLARLALAACDLADPFQMTVPGPDEVAGARVRFGDALAPATLTWLTGAAAEAATAVAPGRALEPALALARASAALRDSAERLAAGADTGAFERLQRERLAAAAALVRGTVLAAWPESGAPAVASGAVRVRPNPVYAGATLTFVAAAAGAARIEVFDVAGRRVGDLELGVIAAGPHAVTLERSWLGVRSPGLYLVRINLPVRSVTGRFVLCGS